MKTLTAYQFSCNGYMVSELGQSRISLVKEHNTYHLKHNNILSPTHVWEVETSYTKAIQKFKVLKIIQKGQYLLKNYEVTK